jgi:hypothetical protein
MDTQKKRSCFNDFLKMFDYFGVYFTFRIKEKSQYQSRFGGLIFILFLLEAISYFSITFIDFWQRDSYTINYSITVTKPAPKINFFKSGFNFAYSLQYDNDTFTNPSDLSFLQQGLILTKLENSNISKKNKTNLDTKFCEFKDFYDKIDENTFNSLNLQKFTCAKIDESVSIQGTFADPIYQYIELGILLKDEVFTNDPNVTINLEYVSDFLAKNPVKLVLYWIDTTINVRDYPNPISSYIRTYLTYLDFLSVKKSNLDFSVMQFSSDSNVLIQNPEHQNSTTFMETQDFFLSSEDRLQLGSLGKTIMKFFMRSSPKNTIIDRSYMKFTQFLANFGGLQSNILLGLFIFICFLNTFWAEQKIMNRILKFREHLKVSHPNHYNLLKSNLRSGSFMKASDKNINSKENYEPPEQISLSNSKGIANQGDDFNPDNYKENNENQIPLDINIESKQRQLSLHHLNLKERKPISLEKHEENTLARSKKPVNFNCFEIICRKCPCRSKTLSLKNKFYKKASKKIEYYFDIFTYVKKMQEIDIMKYLLLDKDQIKLFNFLSKPSISMAYSDSDDIYQTVQKNRIIQSKIKTEEIEEIIQSYNVLKGKSDVINDKLFYLFDYEIDHLLIG